MRIVRIKNRYLFDGDKPNGIHSYAVYYDRKTKQNRVIGLTHLFVKDKKRFNQIKRGLLMKENFKEFETPTGVKNYYFSKNYMGEKIDLTDKNNVVYISKKHLSKKQADKIKNFAKKNINK